VGPRRRAVGQRRVVLGGTSPFGGRGSLIAALVGSLLIGMINNGMQILAVALAGRG
jgi:ribose/xylose/arabinose/galactoside ABC-type transport system permease subunit